MAKKRYISPLFQSGLDAGEHTEPYTNSEDIYTPDNPSGLYPDFSGLSEEQMLYILSLSQAEAWALDLNGDGTISADEFPSAPSSGS